jgi:phage replication-related protein YjqB (UPF0714/DUF867 family)
MSRSAHILTQKVAEVSRAYRSEPDKLSSFSELLSKFRESEKGESHADFSREVECRGSPTCIIALHGGNLEFGTAELALDLAGTHHSYYIFRSHLPVESNQLWLTSTKYDDPSLMNLLTKSKTVLSIHGCEDPVPGAPDSLLYIGGRDRAGRKLLMATLREAGIPCFIDRVFPGIHPLNPCNRGESKAGIQLELTRTFREKLLLHYQHSAPGESIDSTVFAFLNVMRQFLTTNR